MTVPCVPWTFDHGPNCDEWDGWSQGDRDLAEAQAAQLMRAWTLGLYGGCPVTIRPNGWCGHAYARWPGSYGGGFYTQYAYPGFPYGSCACAGLTQLALPSPVGSVQDVLIDGVPLDPSAYRVDLSGDGYTLVRMDGESWPTWQDMTVPADQAGTFAITLTLAYPVDAAGQRAGAVLAEELVKMGKPGAKCRLPDRVTNMVRQGVSVQLSPVDFARGVTGLREVDLYLAVVNPNRLSRAPAVYSPDMPTFRQTIWPPNA